MGSFLHDIRQIETFQSLVQTGSFTATAREMNVTQAAISYSIKNLETSLGCKLFIRSGRNISLTAQGELLLPHCTTILQRIAVAEEEVLSFKQCGTGTLKLGGSEAACDYLLQSLLKSYQQSYPNVKIELIPADTDDLLLMLDSGRIDLAVGVHIPTKQKSPYVFYKLFDDQKQFIVSKNHPWAKKESITVDDIVLECIITATRHSKTKELITTYIDGLGKKIERVIDVFSVDIQKKMVMMDLGVGIASSWMLIKEISEGNLIAHTIPDQPIERQWGVMANRDHVLSNAQQAFVMQLKDSVANFLTNTPN